MKPPCPAAALAVLALLAGAAACATAPPLPEVPKPLASARAADAGARLADEPVPTLELPGDVRAVRERLELFVDPDADTFRGVADLELALDRPRDVLWLHGLGFTVSRVEIVAGGAPVTARWEEVHPSGVAKVSLSSAIPSGHATLHVEWTAPYSSGAKGLFVSKQGGQSYVASQFEAIAARRAFPCLDQPSAKIPYEISLVVKKGHAAISNARETRRVELRGEQVRVHFAPTKPIPSYLVAFAVGPYDVVSAADVPPNAVRAMPLPLRGVAPRGRGPELAYALSTSGALLTKLEEYFGVAYPYEKLDLLAIPEQLGAMENVGAITFSEDLLLFDPKTAPEWQRRAFATTMTHEMAHQWFGDLVTMRWWDDLWLNEAFATWAAAKITDQWDPKIRSGLHLQEGIQAAVQTDSLASARAIRQPIASTDDIENAFDGLTYQKGAGVIGMFEHYVGEEVFRRGVKDHLEAHRFGTATSDEFLASISAAAGKDVGPAFHTFLDQAGVPFLEVGVRCDGAPRVHVKQSRFLPLGSTAAASAAWQIPFCARYAVKGAPAREACALLTAPETDVPLEGAACPEWVMPNARAGGYYRFALAPADLAKLRKEALKDMGTRERMAFADGLQAAWSRATLPFADVLEAASPLATDPNAEVAGAPTAFLATAREWLTGDPARAKVEAFTQRLLAPVARDLGYAPKAGEPATRGALRRDVLHGLIDVGRDPAARAELAKRGRAYLTADGEVHRQAVAPDLATLALLVASEGGDAKTLATLRAALGKSENATERRRFLTAAAGIRAPEVAEQVRGLALDKGLRGTEVLLPLWSQAGDPDSREAAWQWLEKNYDAVAARIKDVPFLAAQLVNVPGGFCDDAHADQVQAFFEPRAKTFDGGPREVASVVESIRICARLRKAQEPSVRAFFGRK